MRLSICLSVCLLIIIISKFIKRHVCLQKAAEAPCLSVSLSVCLSPKCKNAIFSKTKQFRAIISIDDGRPIGSRTWAFQRTHYWTSKIQDGGDPPSWILTPKCKNAIFSKKTKQFRAMVSIGPLKYKMAEIRHLGS